MIKFLVILFAIGYIFYKVGGFLFRIFLGGLGAKTAYQQNNQRGQRYSQAGRQQKKTTADGISIDYVPNDKNEKSAKNFKGGEYFHAPSKSFFEELKPKCNNNSKGEEEDYSSDAGKKSVPVEIVKSEIEIKQGSLKKEV